MTEPQIQYVGFWPRVAAALIDTVLMMAITMPLLVWIYGWEYFDAEKTTLIAGPADLLISWIAPAAAVTAFWLARQATPGKMVVSARVVDEQTGNTLTVGQAFGRYLGYYVAVLPFMLGIIWVAFDQKKQGWHDKLAGTVVIKANDRNA